jgi:hypothetical protein
MESCFKPSRFLLIFSPFVCYILFSVPYVPPLFFFVFPFLGEGCQPVLAASSCCFETCNRNSVHRLLVTWPIPTVGS